MLVVSKRLDEAGKMPIVCTRACSLPRQHFDQEILLSQWSTETNTFVTAWREFNLHYGGCPPIDTRLTLGEANSIGI